MFCSRSNHSNFTHRDPATNPARQDVVNFIQGKGPVRRRHFDSGAGQRQGGAMNVVAPRAEETRQASSRAPPPPASNNRQWNTTRQRDASSRNQGGGAPQQQQQQRKLPAGVKAIASECHKLTDFFGRSSAGQGGASRGPSDQQVVDVEDELLSSIDLEGLEAQHRASSYRPPADTNTRSSMAFPQNASTVQADQARIER